MLALESGEQRHDPNLINLGVLTVAASLLVCFGALFAAWLSLRAGATAWPPKGVSVENYYGTTLSLTMLFGVFVAEWASWAVKRGERTQAISAYALLIALGLAMVNLLSFVVHVSHFGPATHAYGAVFFAFNILMGTAVIVAVAAAIVTLTRFMGGQVSAREPALARSAAWLWHAAAAGWLVMYTAIYVVK